MQNHDRNFYYRWYRWRCPRHRGVPQVAESKITSRERNPALISHELQSEGSPDRVLEALLK